MIAHYVLSLTSSAQQLSKVYGDYNASGAQADDRTWRSVKIQGDTANTGPVYVGGYGTLLSTSAWGIYIPVPSSNVPAAPIDLGPSRLDAITALATSAEKLHITVSE